MTDMTMIERVARAIAKSAHGDDEGWAAWVDEARAAVEALREPTEAMERAIPMQEYTIEHYHGSGHHRSFPLLGSGPLQVWRTMVDAALSEHPNKD